VGAWERELVGGKKRKPIKPPEFPEVVLLKPENGLWRFNGLKPIAFKKLLSNQRKWFFVYSIA
jgi:hypothetical protein